MVAAVDEKYDSMPFGTNLTVHQSVVQPTRWCYHKIVVLLQVIALNNTITQTYDFPHSCTYTLNLKQGTKYKRQICLYYCTQRTSEPNSIIGHSLIGSDAWDVSEGSTGSRQFGKMPLLLTRHGRVKKCSSYIRVCETIRSGGYMGRGQSRLRVARVEKTKSRL